MFLFQLPTASAGLQKLSCLWYQDHTGQGKTQNHSQVVFLPRVEMSKKSNHHTLFLEKRSPGKLLLVLDLQAPISLSG